MMRLRKVLLLLDKLLLTAAFYLFKVNNRNKRKRCEICQIPERIHCRRSRVFIVNFKHISYLLLLFLFLNLNYKSVLQVTQKIINSGPVTLGSDLEMYVGSY